VFFFKKHIKKFIPKKKVYELIITPSKTQSRE